MKQVFNRETALALWREAAQCEFGGRFEVDPSDVQNVMARMYDFRNEVAEFEPELRNLSLRISDDGTEIWLTRKEARLED